jgi:hypothetical protein
MSFSMNAQAIIVQKSCVDCAGSSASLRRELRQPHRLTDWVENARLAMLDFIDNGLQHRLGRRSYSTTRLNPLLRSSFRPNRIIRRGIFWRAPKKCNF